MAQPLDVLILGPFVFEEFAVPERLPLGGAQAMHVHKLPGGRRVIDTMGPNDRDRSFTAAHWGSRALSDHLTLDAMRVAGTALAYTNGAEARSVVISDYTADVEKFNYIPFSITLVPIDTPGTQTAVAATPDALVASDAAAAQATAAANAGGIGHQ
jgi:hypothetical protein